MTYPQLIGLRVARRHRRATSDEPLLDGVPLLEALLDDLKRIEELANEVLREPDPSAQKGLLDKIRKLMSLDARPLVLDSGGEWHRRLQAGISHDRELIGALLLRSTAEPWRRPADMKPEAQREISEPPEQFGPPAWKGSAAMMAATDELWVGHVQDKVGEHARRYRLPALELKDVEVSLAPSAGQGSGPLAAQADISISDRMTVSARVQPGSGRLEATLWFVTTQENESHPRWWPFGRSAKPVWEALFQPPPERQTGLLTEIVELLRDAWVQRSTGKRSGGDLPSLREALRKYSGGPTAMVCGLAAHFGALSDKEQRRARSLLGEIVTNTEWRLLASCFVPLVSKLAPDATLAGSLYSAFWQRCPMTPVPGDLLALVTARAKLSLNCPLLRLVRTLCQSGLAAAVVRVAGSEMRDMLGPETPATAPPTVIHAIAGAVKSSGAGGRLYRPLKELRPIVKLLDHDGVAELLTETGQWLSQRLIIGKPGMWPPDVEALRCIEAVESFLALAGGLSPWNEDALAWSRLPLPHANGVTVCYPGTMWPLLRRWLTGDGLTTVERANYQADVACWWLRVYCEAGERAASLTRCGQWLAAPRAEPAVFRQLTDAWAGALSESQPRATEALELLLTPALAASSAAVFRAIRDSVALEVWKERCPGWTEVVAFRWKRWVEAVASGGNKWRAAWAALCLCGVLFDPDSQRRQSWIGHLHGQRSELAQADSDVCLSHFEWRVFHERACSVEEAFGRLQQVYRWRWVPSRGASRLDWLPWCEQVRNLAPNVMQPATALRLQVAALTYARDPLEREVKGLWPSVPLELLLNGHRDEFEQFVNFAKMEGLIDDKLRLDLARALLTAATPARPCISEISALAQVLFAHATFPFPPAPTGA